MPRNKRNARKKEQDTKSVETPSPDTLHLGSSASATPDPPLEHEDQDLVDPALGELPELPPDLEFEENLEEPQAGNLPLPEEAAAERDLQDNPVVVPQPDEPPEAMSSDSNEAACGSSNSAGSGGGSGNGDSRPASRSDIEEMLLAQASAMDRLNLMNDPIPEVDVQNMPSFSGGPVRLHGGLGRSLEGVRFPNQREVYMEENSPEESEFYAEPPGASGGPEDEDEDYEEMETTEMGREGTVLVCERCGEQFFKRKAPRMQQRVVPASQSEEQEGTDEPAEAESRNSDDSGTSSSRASSAAICPRCSPFESLRTSTKSTPLPGDSSRGDLDQAAAPNVTIDASHGHVLPDYSTERVPSAPPPVYAPMRQRDMASTNRYNPLQPSSYAASDSLRHTYAAQEQSDDESRLVPSMNEAASNYEEDITGTGTGPYLSQNLSDFPEIRNGGISAFPPESIPGSSRSASILASPARRAGVRTSFSPQGISPMGAGSSAASRVSPEDRVCLRTLFATPVRQQDTTAQSQFRGSGESRSDAASMLPPPGPATRVLWFGASSDSESPHPSRPSPDRMQQFSPSRGAAGGRRRLSSSGSNEGGAGPIPARPSIVSPGRATPYGHSPRRRHLTGESRSSEGSQDLQSLAPGFYSSDNSGAGPSNMGPGTGTT